MGELIRIGRGRLGRAYDRHGLVNRDQLLELLNAAPKRRPKAPKLPTRCALCGLRLPKSPFTPETHLITGRHDGTKIEPIKLFRSDPRGISFLCSNCSPPPSPLPDPPSTPAHRRRGGRRAHDSTLKLYELCYGQGLTFEEAFDVYHSAAGGRIPKGIARQRTYKRQKRSVRNLRKRRYSTA